MGVRIVKNVDKWLYPFCVMIANGDRCPANYAGYAGSCDECELNFVCNDAIKLYDYMNKEIEGNNEK